MNNFNIHVTCGTCIKLFSCSSRREFGTKVSRFFDIEKSSMQFFEINKKSRQPITINDIKDKMKVEVKKICPNLNSETNGEKTEKTESESVEVPDVEELQRKLRENRVLTGLERKFILHLIQNPDNIDPSNKKRKRTEEDRPVEKVNKKVQVDYGGEIKHTQCTQTDPKLVVQQEEPSSSKNLINESKRLARCEKKDKDKVRQLMNKTFEDRRQFILLKHPVLHMVKEKYPLLFSADEVINELNRIFYDNKHEEFLSCIKSCSRAILSMVDPEISVVKTITKAIDAAKSDTQKSYARQVAGILLISNLVHEKRTYLYTEDEPCEKNNYPRIEAPCEVSKLFEDVNTYRIIVEGLVLCEASTFPEAILCLMASYFIFNISYPEQSENTFIVMEKVFLEANDTDMNNIDEATAQIIRNTCRQKLLKGEFLLEAVYG